jgi:hypothetical protein
MPSALSIVQKFYPEVETVVDAEEDVQIEVTKRIAQSAAVKNHKKCAVAVSCEKQLDVDGAVVSLDMAYLVKGTEATRLRVPRAIQRELVSFDRDAGFMPGHYTLKAPDKWHRLGHVHTNSGKHKGNKKRSKTATHFTENVRTALNRKESLA